jgi:succinate-semialdehyde dehydrogenase/glutarate-semialdehyde dehydrogenase
MTRIRFNGSALGSASQPLTQRHPGYRQCYRPVVGEVSCGREVLQLHSRAQAIGLGSGKGDGHGNDRRGERAAGGDRSLSVVGTHTGAFIGGRWVDGDGEEIEVINPTTGGVIGTVVGSTAAQVDAAVEAATRAFPTWRKKAVLERVDMCRHAFTLCEDRLEEVSAMISLEVGKPIRDCRTEMRRGTVEHFRRAAEDVLRNAGKVLPDSMEYSNTKRIIVVQEPVGVVAAITPWNFPIDIAAIPIVYGLALGCTVVWKPSEYAPLCAQLFTEVFQEAGFPDGTLNVVHGRGDTGSALVRHPKVAAVAFTGSVETGEKVARDAGLKSRILELGGNGPQIVLKDADIGDAADAAARGCFFLSGQCCTAAERVLVDASIKEAFVQALHDRVKSLRMGDPSLEETDMGPLRTPAVLARTQEHIRDAVEKGASIVCGGESHDQFHEPTILDGVTSNMRIAQEETFGPVAPIMTFSTLEEAIAIANETEFGLTASVFTQSLDDAWYVVEELRHGTVHVNRSTNTWDQMAPFGGMKKSGSGRELSTWMIDGLSETKQITFTVRER